MPESRTIHQHASAAETTTFTSGDLNTSATSFLLWLINTSAISGTGASMTCSIQSKDEYGTYFSHVASTPITTVSQQTLSIGPGCSTNLVIGRICRLVFTISGTTPSITFASTLYGDV